MHHNRLVGAAVGTSPKSIRHSKSYPGVLRTTHISFPHSHRLVRCPALLPLNVGFKYQPGAFIWGIGRSHALPKEHCILCGFPRDTAGRPAVAMQKFFLGSFSFGRMHLSLRATKTPPASLFRFILFFLDGWFVETAPNKTDVLASFSTLLLCPGDVPNVREKPKSCYYMHTCGRTRREADEGALKTGSQHLLCDPQPDATYSRTSSGRNDEYGPSQCRGGGRGLGGGRGQGGRGGGRGVGAPTCRRCFAAGKPESTLFARALSRNATTADRPATFVVSARTS